MTFDGDPKRSAAHLNLLAHLSGPFREGANDTPIPTVANGAGGFVGSVDRGARRPLLVAGTRTALGPQGFTATITVTPRDGAAAVTRTLRFAAFTEVGAFLPVWHSDDDVAPGVDCTIAVDGGPEAPDPLGLVELRVVEGVLGRMLYVIGAEKARLRRQGRELFELRRLDFEIDADSNPDHRRFGDALDRLGADLGVPRFADRLGWDAGHGQVLSVAERESNEAYRRRLAMMRPRLLPTRRRVVVALAGSPSGETFAVNEANADLAVAIQLVSSPGGAARTQFLAYLRDAYLVAPGAAIPEARPLPSSVRRAQQAVLDRIGGVGGDVTKASFEVPAGAFMAPLLAETLDRVGRCRIALGVTRRWQVRRAQDDGGGSRYEMGLGIDVEPLPAAELDELAQRCRARQYAAATDVETVALLDSLTPAASGDDPTGRWLLASAGLRTIQPIAGGSWYLSHFPTYGMSITVAGGSPLGLEGRFHAPGDPGPNAVLWFAIADIQRDATAAGIEISQLTPAAAAAAIAAATPPTAATGAALTAAGLRTPNGADDLGRTTAALAQFPAEQLTVIALGAGLAAGVLAGNADQVAQLAHLVEIIRAREIVSAVPLVVGGGVAIVLSSATLSGGTRLNSPRQGFRWYVLPIKGLSGSLDRDVGARARYTAAAGASLDAIVAVSMARRDRADPRDCIPPYQVRVQMPAGQHLDLAGYERLMNLLERVVPIGVVVDTGRVRESGIAPGGDGQPVPFIGRLAHAFRAYRQRRHLGNMTSDRIQ